MSKSSPKAPDPVATANAQAQANKDAVAESAKINSINQYTPYGSVVYQKDANGIPTSVTTSLTPTQQQALDQQNQLAVALGGQAMNQAQYLPTDKYSLAKFGAAPTAADFEQQGNQVRDAYFQQQMGMLDPTFAQESSRLEQNIANRGLPITGEGAKTLEDNLARRQNDARLQAANSAITAGGNEQTRLYNMAMGSRQQGISEYNQERQQPFNELSAYLTGQPVFSAPKADTPTYQVAPADIAGNVYNSYNAKSQAAQNNMSGMYQLGGSALMALALSDRRLKRNIKRIGRLSNGLNVYRYRYLWGKELHVGLMADEVSRVVPDAVVKHATGFDMVDYSKVA